MGVIYKLTQDVVDFILAQKQKSTNLSCRQLVILVEQQFGRAVSKSSVHEVLKEANIVSPRGRKYKNKFEIPTEKKAQLAASLPPAMAAAVPKPVEVLDEPSVEKTEEILGVQGLVKEEPSLDEPLKLRVEPMVILPPAEPEVPVPVVEMLPPLQESDEASTAQDIFLQAAFWDLFPRPWNMIKSQEDLAGVDAEALAREVPYRMLKAASLRVHLEDGSVFYIDARRYSIGGAFNPRASSAPIEGAVIRMADDLLNNIQMLIIHEVGGDFFDASGYDFLRAMNNEADKRIARIVLVGEDQQELVDFAPVPRVKRAFVLGVSVHNKDIEELIQQEGPSKPMVNVYVCPDPVCFWGKNLIVAGNVYRGIVIYAPSGEPEKVLLTNSGGRRTDQEIVTEYLQAFPRACVPMPAAEGGADEENLLMRHAKTLFGEKIFKGARSNLALIRAQGAFNAGLKIITLMMPDGYDGSDEIKDACTLLNGLHITDYQGRKIWARAG